MVAKMQPMMTILTSEHIIQPWRVKKSLKLFKSLFSLSTPNQGLVAKDNQLMVAEMVAMILILYS